MKDFSEKPNKFRARSLQIRPSSLLAERFVRLPARLLACYFSDLEVTTLSKLSC